MPEEIEVPLDDSQDRIRELHEKRHLKDEEEAEGGQHAWTRLIGLSTALLAVIAAIGSLVAGRMVNEALLAKNDQVGHLTQASDTWNYYQAEGLKSLIYATSGQSLPPASPIAAHNADQAKRYKAKQLTLQDEAKALEKRADEDNLESRRRMDQHEVFALSVSLCQIAIGLSAVAALTRRRRIWYAGLGAGLVGTILLVCGFLPHFKLPF